jgi:hypothetical protein
MKVAVAEKPTEQCRMHGMALTDQGECPICQALIEEWRRQVHQEKGPDGTRR